MLKMPSKIKKSSNSNKKAGKEADSSNDSRGSPSEFIAGLKNRHFVYYNVKKKYKIPFRLSMKMNNKSCLSETFNPDSIEYPNVHLGQRKLLLSEVQVLIEYYKQYSTDPVLLYIGAATGTHLVCLHKMFPRVKFILYDGSKFDPALKKYPDIFEIHTGDDGFFTTEKCKKLKNSFDRNLVFVSDIRSTVEDFEPGVAHDLTLQQEWVKILEPEMSLLKFRFPYDYSGSVYKYLKGQIFLGIWATPMAGETRLLIRKTEGFTAVDYDVQLYEKLMFFHNKYKRLYAFEEDVSQSLMKVIKKPDNIYCCCFDCMAELTVLSEYCNVMNSTMERIIKLISYHMNPSKTPVFLRKSVRLDGRPLIPIDDLIADRCSSVSQVE